MDTTETLLLPPGGSTIAGDVDALFYFIVYASIAIFGIVLFGIVYLGLKYRGRKAAADGTTPGITHSTRLELAWSIIPAILVIIVFVWGFNVYMKMNIIPGDVMEVKVTAQKWFWSFDYPDGVNTVNELVVPLGKPVKLLMSSRDVIHSFYVPAFRIKMDVLPNRYTLTWFEATAIGSYDIMCAEFCGDRHSEMLGRVRVVSEREYKEWLESGTETAEGATPVDYGRALFRTKACHTCHNVDGTSAVGPALNGIVGKQRPLAGGERVTVDENYLRESILEPQSSIAAGYQPVMPTYQGMLNDKQVDALIAYIKSLK
ncbi:MAG: cytochrome c oxidase subunit II [Candidatus Zixiibacteriota bacterium]|nr:MAG: cytochrome c oxidase subunit II [candidate division Zixibacteria bacterium]